MSSLGYLHRLGTLRFQLILLSGVMAAERISLIGLEYFQVGLAVGLLHQLLPHSTHSSSLRLQGWRWDLWESKGQLLAAASSSFSSSFARQSRHHPSAPLAYRPCFAVLLDHPQAQ